LNRLSIIGIYKFQWSNEMIFAHKFVSRLHPLKDLLRHNLVLLFIFTPVILQRDSLMKDTSYSFNSKLTLTVIYLCYDICCFSWCVGVLLKEASDGGYPFANAAPSLKILCHFTLKLLHALMKKLSYN